MYRREEDQMTDKTSKLVRIGETLTHQINIGRHALVLQKENGSETEMSIAEFLRVGAWLQCTGGASKVEPGIDKPWKDRLVKYGAPLTEMIDAEAERLECSAAEVFRRGARLLCAAIKGGRKDLIFKAAADRSVSREIVRIESWP